MSIIDISNVDIVYGKGPQAALKLLDQGQQSTTIKEATGHTIAVQGVNVSINRGEIFVIMGLSGSGKSTLLRAINGLERISRGQIDITVNNEENRPARYSMVDADDATLQNLRTHHISMVFQNFALFPWKTVAKNVAFGLEIARKQRGLIEQRVKHCLELVGLLSYSERYPSELSGAMQQMVGLARALATDADIILMDEPFSALAPLIKKRLHDELLKLQRDLYKTIVFITHDLDEALKLGSRIAIMQDGKIVQIGRSEEIIRYPKTSFVRDFVAHVDQTKVLRARAIMTSLADLTVNPTDSSVVLDPSKNVRCLLDNGGRPRRSLCGDVAGRIVPWTLYQSGRFTEHDIVLGNEHLMIKDLIDTIGRTKKPMVIKDRAGKMIGAVTSESILNALSLKS